MGMHNFREKLNELKTFLPDYLREKGINIEGKFSCLNPAHEDKHPSMNLLPEGTVAYCHSCKAAMDIFSIVSVLENKPTVGRAFITDTVAPLADKYNVEIQIDPLTEDDIYEMDTYRAYDIAAKYIKESERTEAYLEELKKRGWDDEVCKEMNIGCIANYPDFRSNLAQSGYSADFIDGIDLKRKDLFGPDKFIFTIKDEWGRPVGFASRNLNYEKNKSEAKYVNQKTTGVRCNIYRKSSRLFGFDRARKLFRNQSTSLYIFEGYADAVTAIHKGVNNVVALGGTALTTEHVLLLKSYGFQDIILALDPDKAGQERTQAILDKVLSGHKDLRVRIVVMPGEEDPDVFLREQGSIKFEKLKKWTAFEWRLARFDDDADSEQICNAMIPLIVNESSYIVQDQMIRSLSMSSGVECRTLALEVERLQNEKANELASDRKVILDKLAHMISKSPAEAENAIMLAESQLFELAKRYNNDSFSKDSTMALIQTQKEKEESKDGSFAGFRLGPDLYFLEQALAGEWKQDVWIVLGGKANTGKTSLLVKMTMQLAMRKEHNNALVIYHSIDDTGEQILPKFVAIAHGDKDMSLNQISDPQYYVKGMESDQGNKFLHDRQQAYKMLSDMVEDERIILKDANNGKSMAYIERLIKYHKERHPDRNIVYILDNFHKLHDGNSNKDERVRVKELSSKVKSLATAHHITVITSVEYKKVEMGKRATNTDIAESGQIEYDSNLVINMYNELHEKQEKCNPAMVHYAENPDYPEKGSQRFPIVEASIGKNKITGFKEKLYFEFYPFASDFSGVDSAVVATRMEDGTPESRDFSSGNPFG